MTIKEVEVKNFRILEDACIDLDKDITYIVGRNNTGKTSLAEVFYKFFNTEISKFHVEDFSLNSYENLRNCAALYDEYLKSITDKEADDLVLSKEEAYKDCIPKIELSIKIEYEESDNLASLSNFIMDLDPNRKDVMITCEFAPKNYENLIKAFKDNSHDYNDDVIEFLRKNIQSLYSVKYYAVDSNDRAKRNEIEEAAKKKIENVFLTRFINAQRILDDQSSDRKKGLSKGFGDYYKYNKDGTPDILNTALLDTSLVLDDRYKDYFQTIFTDLQRFGANTGINAQELQIKSNFDVEKVLKDNINLYYKSADEMLPESYNGLGYSNLIFIVLSFLSYFEEFFHRNPVPNFGLLFIEEPEAHFHPQMQQVFVKNIKSFIATKGWNVQLVITTHSSHVIAESGFENIRYFDHSEEKLVVKNLAQFESSSTVATIEFLRQYMTLYRCDMFFADKVILIEGVVERLLLPKMIEKVAPELSHQYVSVIEVGGAYAQNFKDILEFINVKTLVISDIDSINTADGRKKVRG